MKQYWLVKTEGDCYSIDDLRRDKRTAWTGIRNYQARNFIRDGMKPGDEVLVYHSSGNPNGIYGLAKVASKPYADPTQFDSKDEHFDAASVSENPRWFCVDMEFVKKFESPLTLEALKRDPELSGMLVCRTGNRLSVMPVRPEHFQMIKKSRS